MHVTVCTDKPLARLIVVRRMSVDKGLGTSVRNIGYPFLTSCTTFLSLRSTHVTIVQRETGDMHSKNFTTKKYCG